MKKKIKKKSFNDVLVSFINKLFKKHHFLHNVLKVIYISSVNFLKNKCFLRASSLTYYSLMAIVPFFAFLFGIGKIFGYQKFIENELIERFQEQKELINELVKFANNLLVEAKGGMIAIFGVLFLSWSVIKLFTHIESSLNSIFKAKRRKIKNQFGLYVSLLLIIPTLLVCYSSIKIYLTNFFVKEVIIDTFFERFFYVFMQFVPYIIICALFFFVFVYMPNVKVKFKTAVLAAIISGIVYQFIQYFYVNFQVGFTRYNAIYGSFTALPLFLIWLQVSWLIFLFGAELSSAMQNVNKIRLKFKKV